MITLVNWGDDVAGRRTTTDWRSRLLGSRGGTPSRWSASATSAAPPRPHVVLEAAARRRPGLDDRVAVHSCGTGDWHVGRPMDQRAAADPPHAGYDAEPPPRAAVRRLLAGRARPGAGDGPRQPRRPRRPARRASRCSATSTPSAPARRCPTRTTAEPTASPRCWRWSSAPRTPSSPTLVRPRFETDPRPRRRFRCRRLRCPTARARPAARAQPGRDLGGDAERAPDVGGHVVPRRGRRHGAGEHGRRSRPAGVDRAAPARLADGAQGRASGTPTSASAARSSAGSTTRRRRWPTSTGCRATTAATGSATDRRSGSARGSGSATGTAGRSTDRRTAGVARTSGHPFYRSSASGSAERLLW